MLVRQVICNLLKDNHCTAPKVAKCLVPQEKCGQNFMTCGQNIQILSLSGQTWTLQTGLVFPGWENLLLLSQPGGQGEQNKPLCPLSFLNNTSLVCSPYIYRMSSNFFSVASGSAADEGRLGAGGGPIMWLRRGLWSRKSWFSLLPLHLSGAAQRAESYVPADRHQAGEGTGSGGRQEVDPDHNTNSDCDCLCRTPGCITWQWLLAAVLTSRWAQNMSSWLENSLMQRETQVRSQDSELTFNDFIHWTSVMETENWGRKESVLPLKHQWFTGARHGENPQVVPKLSFIVKI